MSKREMRDWQEYTVKKKNSYVFYSDDQFYVVQFLLA